MRIVCTHLAWGGVVLGLTACAATAEIGSGSFDLTGPDTTSRFFHRASVLPDGHVLVTGGMGLVVVPPSLFSLNTMSFFDPATQTYSSSYTPSGGGGPVSPVLATPRSSHTQTTLLDGRALITGGRTGANGTNPGSAVSSVEIFDPATGMVTAGPAMFSTRADHTATLLSDGRVIVAGGGGTWQVFTPGPPDTWSGGLETAATRFAHAAVRLPDDTVLLIGGTGSGPATIERLDPATGLATFSAETLSVGVDDLAAGLLDDGTVLIVGGQNVSGGDTVDLTWIYDPDADMLTAALPPPGVPQGISDHVLIPLGRYALILGGEQQVAGVDTELDYAGLYDRVTGDWTLEFTMNFPHDDAAAVQLSDGRVLVIAGGVPLLGNGVPSANSELFTTNPLRPEDLDCDGVVGVTDFLQLLAEWGPCPAPCPPSCPADFDADCAVGVTDFLQLLAEWG